MHFFFGRFAPKKKMKKKTGTGGGEKPSTIAKSRPKAVRSTRGRLALGVDFREIEKIV